MTSIEEIIFSELSGKKGNVGLITLNRQNVLNALNHKMFLDLDEQLGRWEIDNNIKAVIIRAAEGRAFCAGGDIRHAYQEAKRQVENLPHFFRDEYRLNRRIHYYPKPYIALLDGITMGGGAGISIHGSHRVATENLVFAMPETSIGFFPDIGASYFLPRLPHYIGIYLGLTGGRISASDCCEIGLTNFFVSRDSFARLISAIAETAFGTDSRIAVSKIISNYSTCVAPSTLLSHRNEIESCFSQPTVEEILKSLYALSTEWGRQILEMIGSKSPTSLKVTLHELKEGKKQAYDACMQMEYRLANRFLGGHDFYEGVRAVIIDKDQKPKWQPAKLEEVTEKDVLSYFKPLKNELVV